MGWICILENVLRNAVSECVVLPRAFHAARLVSWETPGLDQTFGRKIWGRKMADNFSARNFPATRLGSATWWLGWEELER